MLFAIGGIRPAGIEGWMPLNPSVVQAATDQEVVDNTAAPKRAESTPLAEKSVITSDQMNNENPTNEKSTLTEVTALAPSIDTKEVSKTERSNDSKVVNINTAGIVELQTLPGIGEKKAQAILDYRNEHGAFTKVSDLAKVKGIGNKTLDKMKPYLGL